MSGTSTEGVGSEVERASGLITGYEDLERALSSVPGIVTASVAVSEATGSGRLRIRLAPGEDPDAVSWAVAATLRERFGISLDPAAIRPRIHDHGSAHDVDGTDQQHDGQAPGGELAPPWNGRQLGPPAEAPVIAAAAGSPAGSADARLRAAIRDLVTTQGERDVEVTATLEVAGVHGTGVARAVPTRRGLWRAVADATIAALGELTGEHLQAGVDRVTVSANGDPAVATVVVTVLSERGEETLVGAALLRDDPEGAVMRATLDALNRRVEPWLPRPASAS